MTLPEIPEHITLSKHTGNVKTSVWAKHGMKRLYINVTFPGKKWRFVAYINLNTGKRHVTRSRFAQKVSKLIF